MLILGIDPGYERMGCAIIDKTGGEEKLVYSACATSDRKDSHETRLLSIAKKLEEIILKFKPDIMAIESLYFTTNQKTATKVAEARGVALYLAAKNKMRVAEYTPLEVKMALTGYGRAEKEQVRKMAQAILKRESLAGLDDEIDAIAVAIACRPSPLK